MKSEELLNRMIELEPSAKSREEETSLLVEIPSDKLFSFLKMLKTDSALSFDMLLDHTAVDLIEQGVFELVY